MATTSGVWSPIQIRRISRIEAKATLDAVGVVVAAGTKEASWMYRPGHKRLGEVLVGNAVEKRAVGNKGQHVHLGGAGGKHRGRPSWELVGGGEGKGVGAACALRDNQHIGCTIHWVGRRVHGRIGRNRKFGNLILGQIPGNGSAGDGQAGGIEIMGAGVLLCRVNHGHTGSDRGRAGADGQIASKGRGQVCDGSGSGDDVA